MRARVIVLGLLAACGSNTVEAPMLTMPARPDPVADADGFTIDPAAPYAKLFVEGQQWTLPATTWIGPGDKPEVTCAVSNVQKFPAAMVAVLACSTPAKLGPLASALPGYGVVATDDGLWITSNAGVIEPPPATADELTTLLASQPIRLAVKPAPIHATREVEHPGTRPIKVTATIDAVEVGGSWCLTDENTAASETVTSVVCMSAKDGLTGALAVYRSHGIVFSALALGTGPQPSPSGPYEIQLAAPPDQVTLVDAGKGKRTPLAIAAVAGAEQQVEYVMEYQTRIETLPPGKPAEPAIDVPLPIITARGTARVDEVAPDGSFQFRFTMTDVTATGPGAKPDVIEALKSLDGFIYLAAVGPDGQVRAAAVHVEHPTPATPGRVRDLVLGLTTFPVLPTEPIGAGARWTVRHHAPMLEDDVEYVITSKLAQRKAGRAVIQSTATVARYDRAAPKGTVTNDGSGTSTVQLAAGALVPVTAAEFKANVDFAPADATAPRRKATLTTRTRVLPK